MNPNLLLDARFSEARGKIYYARISRLNRSFAVKFGLFLFFIFRELWEIWEAAKKLLIQAGNPALLFFSASRVAAPFVLPAAKLPPVRAVTSVRSTEETARRPAEKKMQSVGFSVRYNTFFAAPQLPNAHIKNKNKKLCYKTKPASAAKFKFKTIIHYSLLIVHNQLSTDIFLPYLFCQKINVFRSYFVHKRNEDIFICMVKNKP